MHKVLALAIGIVCTLASLPGFAAEMYPWRNHAAPFRFTFGNHFDTHQQTQRLPDGSLQGFFYITYTGVLTSDGYAVATHPDDCAVKDCTVGWLLVGKPRTAKFLYQPADDHPVFEVPRSDIPQPGGYSHFHWTGDPYDPTGLSRGQTYSGFILQLNATGRFCFIHHDAGSAVATKDCRDNGGVPVNVGLDIATHLNILTSSPY